ncbi:hypothetical protein PGTUg99_005413 [Puccinia graminis f. sp. tritici]|uniref:Uncharacterized protein n=1 Tax=Puccinia graminis f. sp. tritici TaxID=56615 RepID=A0A5B0RHX1_PUCGR|nr:hypothetical protein PGTUg99_005413 [Puccinia graminis f. sp. tritici]
MKESARSCDIWPDYKERTANFINLTRTRSEGMQGLHDWNLDGRDSLSLSSSEAELNQNYKGMIVIERH